MALSIGDRIGPYEILGPIGVGGMGEVWKARDTRLDRVVAIKISKTEFSERFEREARAVAALNHPYICTLHDVGPNYLVMEYVEGSEIKGPLPLAKAIELACQILDALDAAHCKGIVHRDLKPANILVTKSGVKVLDFGLAKMAKGPLPEGAPTAALTAEGAIAGTLQYMAPEQLQGKPDVDSRADIFSFGCVLYEMLTGKRAFDGTNAASIVAAVMERSAPSISEVAPASLDRLLQRCLAKDANERWQTVRDLKAELEWIAKAPSAATEAPAGPARRSFTVWKAVTVLLALIAGGASWAAYRAMRPSALKPLVRLDVDLGQDVSFGSTAGADAILSPDGTRIVYLSQAKLFTRKLDEAQATELTGTEGAYAPFFSPDGQWVAYFTGATLKKRLVAGGVPVKLCDAPFGFGGSWGEDGNIVASLSRNSALSRVSSAGGAPTLLTELAPGEATQRWPQILPGGKAVLFSSSSTATIWNEANIEVMTLADRNGKPGFRKTLERGGMFGRYVPAANGIGYLVYVANGTLLAVPFDPESLETRGTPSSVLQDLGHNPIYGSAQIDFSKTGMAVYRNGDAAGDEQVTVQWLDREGRTQPLLAKAGQYSFPRLSPDDHRLGLDIHEGSTINGWIYEQQRDTMTRLTSDAAGRNIVWSPNGRYIAFEGTGGIFWTYGEGAGKPQLLTQGKRRQIPRSIAPDGKWLAFQEETTNGGYAVWTVPLESDATGLRAGKPEAVTTTSADSRSPMFSHDGRWLAYASSKSEIWQVYVRAFPDKGSEWQVSGSGGTYPVWAHNGRELFFRSTDNRIMVVSYAANGDSFIAEKPRVWSERQLADFGVVGIASYDVAADGKHVAALMPVDTQEAQRTKSHVIFLENFSDDLRRKVSLER
jgi:serine/threonine-protein kinase